MQTITLRFYEELNDFLPVSRRKSSYAVVFPERRSVKDLIESQGVPHTEVDLILINGDPVGFDAQVCHGDRVAVYPVFEAFDITSVSRLGRPPPRVVRFIADVHLGKLVRRLGLLGFDCALDLALDDPAIAEISATEQRILLTRDRRLLMRRIVTHGVFLHSDDPDGQVEEVLDRLDLRAMVRPFSRCPACNGGLVAAAKDAVRSRVPPYTYATYNDFFECDQCAKVYWRGAHWSRLKALVARYTRQTPATSGRARGGCRE